MKWKEGGRKGGGRKEEGREGGRKEGRGEVNSADSALVYSLS